ncbi:MAG: hypothetical protein RLZZ468_2005, partial [Cyanobacteriota bacterium]
MRVLGRPLWSSWARLAPHLSG